MRKESSAQTFSVTLARLCRRSGALDKEIRDGTQSAVLQRDRNRSRSHAEIDWQTLDRWPLGVSDGAQVEGNDAVRLDGALKRRPPIVSSCAAIVKRPPKRARRYSPIVRMTLLSGRVLFDDSLSSCESISSYFVTVVTSPFGTMAAIPARLVACETPVASCVLPQRRKTA